MNIVRQLGVCLLVVYSMMFAILVSSCGDDDDSDLDDDAAPPDDDTVDDDQSDDDVDDDTVDDDTVDDDSVDDDTVDDDTVDDDTVDDDSVDDDSVGWPACDDYGLPAVDGYVGTIELSEIAGLAISYKNPGVMWAHNEAGDVTHVYAMRLDGKFLGIVTLVGAAAVDWEDIAIGPCDADECIYVGDIGDDINDRVNYAVYRFVEPVVDPNVPFWTMNINIWNRYPFYYPDGPHDAEALAVDPTGNAYVFTKYPGGASEMYAFPAMTPEVSITLVDVGALDTGGAMGLTTAADIHRDGLRLLLRTYYGVFEWRLQPGQAFSEIINAPRRLLPFGVEDVGEAIAYDPASGNYLHVGQGVSSPIYRIACQ